MKKNGNKANFKNIYLIYLGIALSFVIGVIYPIVNILMFLLLSMYIITEKDNSKIINLLVFLGPFSTIFKIKADGAALYTYVVLVFIVKMLLTKPIHKKFIFAYMFLAIYCLLGFENGYATALKQLTIPLLLYYCFSPKESINKSTIIKVFIFSLLLGSFIGYFKQYIPNMSNYIVEKHLRISMGVYTVRFSGLKGDPNYYSVNILLGLALTLYLLVKKDIKIQYGIIIALLLIFFGAQTNSKTFILMLAGIVMLAIYTLIKNKRYYLAFTFILIIVLFGYLISTSKISIFNTVLNRFKADSDMSDFTTGRSDIAAQYIEFFNANPIVYLIGHGFNSPLLNGAAPHNTYIDLIYNFGFIGSFIFIYLITFCMRFYNKDRNIVSYIPLIIVMVSYFSLSELTYYDLPLHLILIILPIIGDKKQKYLSEEKKE